MQMLIIINTPHLLHFSPLGRHASSDTPPLLCFFPMGRHTSLDTLHLLHFSPLGRHAFSDTPHLLRFCPLGRHVSSNTPPLPPSSLIGEARLLILTYLCFKKARTEPVYNSNTCLLINVIFFYQYPDQDMPLRKSFVWEGCSYMNGKIFLERGNMPLATERRKICIHLFSGINKLEANRAHLCYYV